MAQYEIWYAEIRRTSASSDTLTSSEQKSAPFDAASDEEASSSAKLLLSAPSDNPLVWMKVRIKLVRVVEMNL